MTRPDVGDLVLFASPYAREGGRTRTGRVLQRTRRELVVESSRTGHRHVRVPVELVRGWWPKGARDRSGAAMREPEAPA